MSSIGIDAMEKSGWFARTSFSASAITVSVRRPRKSNFTSPIRSTMFMSNWVTTSPDFGSR